MRKLVSFVAAAALAAAPLVTGPAAQADGNVTVNFGLAAGTHAPTGAACPVSVPAGSNGLTVLDAAVAKGCIVSYSKVDDPSFGAFVTCINEVCGAPAEALYLTYWGLYVDGAESQVGVSSYGAENGDEMVFSYTSWAGYLVPKPV